MTWSEIFYEEENVYKYCQYSYGPIVEKKGMEDMEYICEILKNKNNPYNFHQYVMILKNIEPLGDMNKFEKFLKNKKIDFKNHIWQKPLLN